MWLEWPGNSPDLNQIENLWTIIRDKVTYKQSSNAENLRQAMKEVCFIEISMGPYLSNNLNFDLICNLSFLKQI